MTKKVYEKNHQFAGFSIAEGKNGWIIETWSAYQGDTTGKKYLVEYTEKWPKGEDLNHFQKDSSVYWGDILFQESFPDRILRKGHKVL